ncbi:MAG: hypothetical protein MHM6MM_001242 [Cercozoa sp. M6MM]
MAQPYSKLQFRQQAASRARFTAEDRYWQNFKVVHEEKLYGPVTDVSFCALEPYSCVVTASTQVKLLDALDSRGDKTYSRFKDVAYSGRVRRDGKLLAAGSQLCHVYILNTQTKAQLRKFVGHRKPCQVVRWSRDGFRVVSGSDDSTVRLWDLAQGAPLTTLSGHSDSVRACDVSEWHDDLVCTGGYDHQVCLWDTRAQSQSGAVSHGAPVESVRFLRGGAMIATAGGRSVKLWDVRRGTTRAVATMVLMLLQCGYNVATMWPQCCYNTVHMDTCTGEVLHEFECHGNTVTALATTSNARLLSASLDQHVRVFDLEQMRLVHQKRFDQPLLSLDVSTDNRSFAVGCADGTVQLRKRAVKTVASGAAEPSQRLTWDGLKELGLADDVTATWQPAPAHSVQGVRPGTRSFFKRGRKAQHEADIHVERVRKQKLAPYENDLRRFQYGAALDKALATEHLTVIMAVLEEIRARNALKYALSHRSSEQLLFVLRWCIRNVANERSSDVVMDVLDVFFDIYGEADTLASMPRVLNAVEELQLRLRDESRVQRQAEALQGTLQCVVSAIQNAGAPRTS